MNVTFLIAVLVLAVVVSLAVPRGGRIRIPGRRRRIVGGALLALGIAGVLGGQVFALATAPADLAADGMDTPVLRPARSGATGIAGRYLARFFTIDVTADGKPRLLEHACFLVEIGERREVTGTAVGPIEPAEYSIEVGTDFAPYTARVGTMSMGGSVQFDDEAQSTQTIGMPRRPFGGRSTATFPDAVYPPFLHASTVLLLDPAPYGAEEVPFSEVWKPVPGNRIQDLWRGWRTSGEVTMRSVERGLGRLLVWIGGLALIFVAVGGVGAALLSRQPGAGLALYLLLAPFLLVASDRIAFAWQEGDLDSPDPKVRTAAMAGLRLSVFFGRSGRRVLEERAGDDGARDVLSAVRTDDVRRVRKYLVTSRDYVESFGSD